MSSLPSEVVIVGGGPVGMLLAAELGAHDIATVVVEARHGTRTHPRAATLHPHTLTSLARRAPAADAAPAAPAGRPPLLTHHSQAGLERRLETAARRCGVQVLRGHRAVHIEQDPDQVHVQVRSDGGTHRLRACYVVGADGAHSTVREMGGFAAHTRPATVSALSGQVRFTDPAGVPLGWRRTERGWTCASCDEQGEGRLLTVDFSGPHPAHAAAPTLQELSAEAARITGRPVPLAGAAHLSRLSDFSRLVTSYRRGRILLAGDSAHTHFPVGGQALDAGLQDALNLGWKLAHTLRGRAGKDLLDTYDRERRPAAQRALDDMRTRLALMRPDPELAPLHDLMADLLPVPEAGRPGRITGTRDLRRRPGPAPRSRWQGRLLANRPLAAGGDLAQLLSQGRPVLLLSEHAVCPRAAQQWTHVLRTARAAAALPGVDAMVVRPDGHVLWASDGGDLGAALGQWFGRPATTPPPARGASPQRSADLSRCLMGLTLEFL
uniref:FAD-dependent monooxygenase n=1 Tax=Streptomyces filipinensis TaxID=66887 RepID=UPI0036E44C29